MFAYKKLGLRVVVCFSILSWAAAASAQRKFTIEQILHPPYPFELVSAKKADRIAWIAYERGMRNVYTAAPPDFKPVRLTANLEDDGNDLSSLRISDDGSVIAFLRGHTPNRNGWIANPTSDPRGSERAVWAIRSSGGKPWRLVEATNPVLSPDGKWVAFAKEGQIYRVPVAMDRAASEIDKGEAPLFRAFGTNSNPVWSPDSKRIAFVSNRVDHTFIGIYDTETPKVTYAAPGVDHDISPTWSSDGKRLAFIRKPGTPFSIQVQAGRQQGAAGGGQGQPGERGQSAPIPGLTQAAFNGGYTVSFYVASLVTGEAREFWHNAPDDTDFNAVNRIQWAGNNVIFEADRNNWQHYYSVSIDGSNPVPADLTPGEGMTEFIGLSGDGNYLYFATNTGDINRRHIWRTPTEGGKPAQLTTGDAIETYPVALGSGGRIAFLNAGAKQPLSVAVMRVGGQPQVIFPDLEGFPLEDQVVPENMTIAAQDGLRFHNQLFLPKDLKPGERRPAVVFIHGGSRRQMLLGYHYMHFYHMAYAINQYLTNQGYIVMSVNYRSGIGYGKEFRDAPKRGQEGNAEYQDILAAGLYLRNRPDVDPTRVGVWGLSYGGILTAQALARNSDVFAAGVDMAGIHLWGNTIDPDSVSYRSSSISAIDRWKSPVLLIHGDDDRNVAFSQTTGLVQLLRAHNIYHELIVFPDDVHDSLLFHRWLKAFNATDDFLRRFLKKESRTNGSR